MRVHVVLQAMRVCVHVCACACLYVPRPVVYLRVRFCAVLVCMGRVFVSVVCFCLY